MTAPDYKQAKHPSINIVFVVCFLIGYFYINKCACIKMDLQMTYYTVM